MTGIQPADLPRSLVAFATRFPADRSCAAFLAELRWPGGFRCACGGTRAWHRASRPRVFQCASCRRQNSVTAGTVMHRATVPLVEWFWAAWAFSRDKGGVSALQLSRVLGRRYETVWRLLHKVRDALAENRARSRARGSWRSTRPAPAARRARGRAGAA